MSSGRNIMCKRILTSLLFYTQIAIFQELSSLKLLKHKSIDVKMASQILNSILGKTLNCRYLHLLPMCVFKQMYKNNSICTKPQNSKISASMFISFLWKICAGIPCSLFCCYCGDISGICWSFWLFLIAS